MHERAIPRLDRAALNLIQALDTYGEDLKPHLEPDQLENLRSEIVSLRRALLGLQMGTLYQDWEAPEDLLDQVVTLETMSVDEAAAHLVDLLSKQNEEEE